MARPKETDPARVNKLSIRAEWARGNTNVAALSRRYNVRRGTISAWIAKEGWGTIAREVREKTAEEADERLAGFIARELSAQGGIAADLTTAAERLVKKHLTVPIVPGDKQNDADVLLALANAVARTMEVARTIHGIRPGQPSVPGEEGKDDRLEITFSVAPNPAESAAS